MNKKYTTYLLLSMTIAIWGFIAYKIYSSAQQPMIHVKESSTLNSMNSRKDDSFMLILNYPDPFTKSRYFSKNSITENSVSTSNQVNFNIDKNTIDESQNLSLSTITTYDIKYFGLIKNDTKKTGMLAINGSTFLVYEGQEIDGIEILSFDKKKISYRNKVDKKTYIINSTY